ncbi:MAG: hypothetical protein RJB64_819 [Pseudomonadota bacterium]
MKHYVKLFSIVSAGTLMGCAHPWLAQAPEPTLIAERVQMPAAPRTQAVERISSPISPVESLFTLGRTAQSAGQLALAEERYAQALVLQPQHLEAVNAMAVLYAQSDRVDQAIALFRRALTLDPNAAHVHNNLGYALLLAGRLDESAVELKLARDLSPSNEQTGKNLERLAQNLERLEAGPQLVAVSRNVYELRDRPGSGTATARLAVPPSLKAEVQLAQVARPVAAASLVVSGQEAAAPDSRHLQGVRLEVSNGVGIRYLARRTAERLSSTGLVPARLTNQAKFQQAKTEIQFSSGQAQAAAALSAQFPVSVQTVASTRLLKNIQLRLVLGHDQAGKALLAWLESATDTRVAAASQSGWRWS